MSAIAAATARATAVAVVVAGFLLAAHPALAVSAATEVADTVNWARMRGCSVATPRTALHESSKLDAAARRVPRGGALRDALTGEGYVASEFGEMHLSGALNEAQASHMLTSAYCRTLTDPKFREVGAQRSGSEVWIVIAAPVALFSQADASTAVKRILELVNVARAAGHRCGNKDFPPAPALTLNASLTAAALAHSREMARFGEFDHRGHDGSTPSVRVQLAGYGPYKIVGENIAAGAMSPAEAARGWLASPPHCENIMDPRFTQIGIAFAENIKDAETMYWTQDFAAPR